LKSEVGMRPSTSSGETKSERMGKGQRAWRRAQRERTEGGGQICEVGSRNAECGIEKWEMGRRKGQKEDKKIRR